MFGSIFTKTLRGYWVAILCWGGGIGLALMASVAATPQLIGSAASKAGMQALASSFTFLAEPVGITSPGGYTTFKVLAFLPLMLGIWTVLAGARTIRGEEERDALDVLLSLPRSRGRALVEKIAALAVALFIMAVIMALCIMAGEPSAGMTVDAPAAFLAAFDATLLAFLFGLIALFFGQVMWSGGAAAGAAGGVMVTFYTMDGTSRLIPGASWLHWFTPYFYYGLSKPLVASYGTNPGGFVVLIVMCMALFAASYVLFIRRDIGGVALAVTLSSTGRELTSAERATRSLNAAARDWSLRSVLLRSLRARMASSLWWAASVGLYALWVATLTRSMEQPIEKLLTGSPALASVFNGKNIGTNAGLISYAVYTFLPIAVVFFAMMIGGTWVSDLDAGRLELITSTPQPRWRVLLETFLAMLVWIVVIPLSVFVGVLVGAAASNLSIDASRVAEASLALIPLELIVAAVVYVLAMGLRSGITQGIVGTIIVVSFLLDFLKDLLKLPNWLDDLSIFHQYGTPMITGLDWIPALAMTVAAIAIIAVSIRLFTSGDLRMSG